MRRRKCSCFTPILLGLLTYSAMVSTILTLRTKSSNDHSEVQHEQSVMLTTPKKPQVLETVQPDHPQDDDDRGADADAAANDNAKEEKRVEEEEDCNVARDDDDDDGIVGDKDDPQISQLLRTVLGPPRLGQLRAFVTREFGSGDFQKCMVGTFLTRVYDPALVKSAGGRRGAAQLMPYYHQAQLRNRALLRMSPGIIDADHGAFEQISGSAVDETLLLVFNDWDHRANAFVAQLEALAARLPLLQSMAADELPAQLRGRLHDAQAPARAVATVRRGAFAALWRQLAEAEAEAKGEALRGRRFFVWPRVREAAAGPVQVIAAIRRADYNGEGDLKSIPFAAAMQSPGLFFCSAALRSVVPFTGAPCASEIAEFVATHTVSSTAIASAAQLRGVLGRFDSVALVVGDTLLLKALLDTTSGAREGLRAVRPTFFVRAEHLDVPRLALRDTRDLPEEALRFMFADAPPLALAPLSDAAQLLLLDRIAPGDTPRAFAVRAVRFPAPVPATDLAQWGKTVGARLADAAREVQPVLRRVTGRDLQFVFEQHMRVSFADIQAQWRRPLVPGALGSPGTSERRLAIVLARRRRSACGSAAAAAAAALSPLSPLRFVAASPRGDLAAELRFAARERPNNGAACEVFVIDANGAVRFVAASPHELRAGMAAALADLKPVSPVSPESARRAARQVSHPSPVPLRDALRELRSAAERSGTAAGELRSARRASAFGMAEWFVWIPPREPAPLVVHESAAAPAAAAAGVQLLLLHDSSCGASANSLKAHRLLAGCQRSAGAPVEAVEFDLSEAHWAPVAGGRLLRTAGKGKQNHTTQRVLFERLEPFLRESHRLQPPQVVALNGTHVVSTVGTTGYYHTPGGPSTLNGYSQSAVRMTSYMDSRIDKEGLLKCMQDSIVMESQERKAFRKN